MRIVGGRLKGRTLLTPSSRAIRPTSERLRESIFDILEHRFPGQIEGARVVDLFAGTGALAIEALSRGARFALLVDNGAEARALLRANVEALALGGVTRIWRVDATKLGSPPAGGPFALAFLDPPYGQGLVRPGLELAGRRRLAGAERALRCRGGLQGRDRCARRPRPHRRAGLWGYADRNLSAGPERHAIGVITVVIARSETTRRSRKSSGAYLPGLLKLTPRNDALGGDCIVKPPCLRQRRA